jgi:hypothetical protein
MSDDVGSPPDAPAPPPADSTSASSPAPIVAPGAAPARTASGFRGRFLLIYACLGVVLAGAIGGLVVIARQPTAPAPPAWSSWRPAAGNSQKVASEVAAHVSSEYKLDASGDQLVAVFPSGPEITHDTTVTKVSTIAIRNSPTSQNFSQIVSTSGAVQEQFCGLGSECSIDIGTPTVDRARLLRREVLEIALYTFKYAPAVSSLIAYMPPPAGETPSTVLFLERSALSKQLSEPLAKTLPLATPPLPTSADTSEAGTIDRLTLPTEYGFQYQPLGDGTQAMILTPGST